MLTLAPGFLKWYENLDGVGNFSDPTIIKDDLPFAITVTAADLRNNGTINPITASQTLNTIYWFEPQDINTPDFSVANVSIYPNPSKEIIHIEIPSRIVALQLYDIASREVLSLVGDNKQINVSTLHNGLYFLHITTPYGRYIHKIIKD